MTTLISPAQVIRQAFADGEQIPPEAITEADIATAEQRYVVPVVGPSLYAKLRAGDCAGFTADYLAAAVALFTRAAIQPRLDIRTGRCGTAAPRTDYGQPATDDTLRRLQQTLRHEARTLLRRASDYLGAHPGDFPEYDAEKDILKYCTTDGGFVQIR